MTWSIVVRDPATGAFGVAVASRFFATGALVPHLRTGLGAIATQAFVNPLWGVDGLSLLAEGLAPEAVIAALAAGDEGRANRQFHLVDAAGRTAAHTGAACVPWCGHRTGDDLSVAGNMLVGPRVVEATFEVMTKTAGRPLVERLLEAMKAGDDAGGDKRGRQSAAIVIHDREPYPALDIRADDHPDPIPELARLWAVAQERFVHFAAAMPTRANPSGMLDRGPLDARIAEIETKRLAEGRLSASFASLPRP